MKQTSRGRLRQEWVYALLVTTALLFQFAAWPTHAAAPTAGLVGYWKFDEASGSTANDSSGSGNTGTLVGGPTRTPAGRVNGALNLDGVDDYVSLSSQSLPATFTVSAWVNFTGNAEKALFSVNNRIFYIDVSRVYRFWNNGSTGSGSFSAVPAGSWQHISYTYNGTTLRGFLNGVQFATTYNGSINSGTGISRIGGQGGGGMQFSGLLDEVRLYNRALSTQEVLDVYNDTGVPPVLDTTPPSIPTGLNAVAVSSSQINLSWTASSDNVGVAGYRIYRCQGAGCTPSTQIGSPTGTSYSNTGLTPSTSYTYAVSAVDAANNASPASAPASATTQTSGDGIAPTVSMTAPANGATVAGTSVTISANASDNVGVAGVQFLLDGANLGTEDATSPYSITWNTTAAASGAHTLSARARDAAGNTTTTTNINVTVDNQAPTGSIVINGGATATNTRSTTLTLSATDVFSAVTQMRFSNTGSSYSAAEAYATTKAWTLSSGTGTKTVYVQFKDALGNWSAGFTDTIVYETTAPTISAVASSNITSNSATITWTTNEPATSQVEYGPTTSYGSLTSLDPNLVTLHTMQLTGLNSQTLYNYRVRSVDAAGNQRIGANKTLTTLAGADTTPPSIPGNLSALAVSPTQINLQWNASTDNVGVTGYKVFRDGVQVATSTVTSYQDTGLARATNYSYAVAAFDAATNVSAQGTAANAATPAMVITNISFSHVTSNTATITWTTDIPATSAVEYGPTTSYGSLTPKDPSLVTNHSVNLTGLAQNTLYHFRVHSEDTSGNRVISGDSVFSSLPAGPDGVFVNESIVSNLNLPVSIEFLPDGKMLILEFAGNIRILRPGQSQVDPTPFLQLTNVGANGLQGLFDMVLDPDFANNHYYYVFYTLGSPNRDRASRFTANASLTGTIPGSEFVIYQDPDVSQVDHHGGALNFGSDGKLYITTGDHFEVHGSSQQLTHTRGKILRLNSDGTIPIDNPFYDGAGPNADSIWALGLRNPFRATIDKVTGRFYIGDVGGNDWNTAIEEINLGAAGANYGWPVCAGTSCGANPLYVSPIHSYSHFVSGNPTPRDAAVTGGFVYRGTQFPSTYVGNYFFADYTQNWIKRLTFDANGNVNGVHNFMPADGSVDGPYGDIVDLAEGPDGALYYVDLGYSDVDGNTDEIAEVRRIRFVSGNPPPTAMASANPSEGLAPLTVSFSSVGSSDPQNEPLTYLWNFGDNATSTQANPIHTYSQTGQYTVRLSVSDGINTIFAEPIVIIVGNRPVPAILTPSDGIFFRAGDVIAFSGNATDTEDGTLPASAFAWTIDFLHGTHVHPGLPTTGVRNGTFQIPNLGHDFSGDTRYRITLTVTDSDGLQSSQSVVVYPDKVNLTFNTSPVGLTLNLDGIARTTPFVHDTLIGFNHIVEAPNQSIGQNINTFVAWSDGGAQQHAIVVPGTNASHIATYSVTQSSGLVAAYDFDEGSGSVLNDHSTFGNHGVILGATWTTGKYGSALQFNGTNALVTINDSSSLHLTSAFTLEAWVKSSAAQSGWIDAIHKASDDYFLETNSWGGVAGGVTIGGSVNLVVSNVSLTTGAWTHIALTYDGASLKLYVNGVLQGTEPVTGNAVTSANPLTLGGTPNGFFQGAMDDVRVYNRALSQSEIQTDMNTPL